MFVAKWQGGIVTKLIIKIMIKTGRFEYSLMFIADDGCEYTVDVNDGVASDALDNAVAGDEDLTVEFEEGGEGIIIEAITEEDDQENNSQEETVKEVIDLTDDELRMKHESESFMAEAADTASPKMNIQFEELNNPNM
jgi:hypothetical protein